MNCVNCGAPPRAGHDECLYCQSLLTVRVPKADYDAFATALRVVKGMSSDMRRVEVMTALRGPFTAGQVRQLLAVFESDMRRCEAGYYLAPRTLNPERLLECAELFSSDMRRSEFIGSLPVAAVSFGKTDSSGSGRDASPRPPIPRPVGPHAYPDPARTKSNGSTLVIVALLVVIAVLLAT